MKGVKNLDELVKLIGMESVEKCFTEYMMLTIAKAKKFDQLSNRQPEMVKYVYTAEFVLTEDCQSKQLLDEIFKALKKYPLPISESQVDIGALDTHLGDYRRIVEIHFKTNIDIEEYELYDKIRQSLFDTCKNLKGITIGDGIETE